MIKKLIFELIIALAVSMVLQAHIIPEYLTTADILFAVCGVLFSVGISLIMSLDFSSVVEPEDYEKMCKGKKNMQIDFFIQFGFSSIIYFLLKLLNEKNLCLTVRNFSIDFHNFLFILLLLCFLFFLINYFPIAKKKSDIEKKIHKEHIQKSNNQE